MNLSAIYLQGVKPQSVTSTKANFLTLLVYTKSTCVPE